MVNKILLALILVLAMIILSPILTILAFNAFLQTEVPITLKSWTFVWVASILAAIPIVILSFTSRRLLR